MVRRNFTHPLWIGIGGNGQCHWTGSPAWPFVEKSGGNVRRVGIDLSMVLQFSFLRIPSSIQVLYVALLLCEKRVLKTKVRHWSTGLGGIM